MCIVLPALAAPPECIGAVEAVTIADVPDARSLALADGRVVRLSGIEPFAAFDPEAADSEERLRIRLGEIAADGAVAVRLLSAKPDRYGRLPALLLTDDALMQARVAAEGLAVAVPESGGALPCFGLIREAEAEGRRQGRGFWAGMTLPSAQPADLLPRVGQFVVFEGTVVSVGTRRATTYIDFGERWSTDTTITIPAKAREAFGGAEALEALAGAGIRARGYLRAAGGPLLEATSPDAIETLAPRFSGETNAP